MKIDRHSPRDLFPAVKPMPSALPPRQNPPASKRRAAPSQRQGTTAARSAALPAPRPIRFGPLATTSLFIVIVIAICPALSAADPTPTAPQTAPVATAAIAAGATDSSAVNPAAPTGGAPAPSSQTPRHQSDPRAVGLLQQVLAKLVLGPAFHAKVRETVWTNGREVVGVGTYEQAGGGSGRFHLQVTMHDGDGKHRLQQISDGRLAWTRTEIAGKVSLRRVDVGRLDEWVGRAIGDTPIAPRLTVGAWAELLSTIERDHVLAVVGAKLEGDPVWVITGKLREERRAEIMAESGRTEWPLLYPTRVHVAIRSQPDAASGFGEMLPVRFEFWSDPVDEADADAAPVSASNHRDAGGRLITLIELYSMQPTAPPPAERFRFENQDAEVNFINETDRYIQMHGVHLTERELRQLRR